ncbi:THAP domain-containing protein 2-like [Ornithodoros turicata]|uniref:THAP domain-containing protein 2-like n=1 Tax=Ornithodoros turicata TaxID=34597 RepID=UPI003138D18A
MKCCAPRCTNRYEDNKLVSYHRFPVDSVVQNRWLRAMNLENWTPRKNSRVCSKHFGPECYEDFHLMAEFGLQTRKALKKDAVPTLFDDDDEEENPKRRKLEVSISLGFNRSHSSSLAATGLICASLATCRTK